MAGDELSERETDVLVVGSGIAGCAAALAAARAGSDVTLATKASAPEDSTSWWAQGGIAVTQSDPDAFRDDVVAASDGLADPDAADVLVENARDAVEDVLLDALDVQFDRADYGDDTDGESGFALGREAAHSERRILHVNASTGKHVLVPFLRHLRALDRVTVLEDTAALDLVTHEGRVHGASLERGDGDGAVAPCFAGATVLATGGIGACYPDSTNPDTATGDGIAMAALAGAEVADMEYVQFHPTALDTDALNTDALNTDALDTDALDTDAVAGDAAGGMLVSEAVRGEGGVLRNADGERFMPAVHPDAELAPRDVVARAVAAERERTGAVRLDVASLDFEAEFPDLADACAARGVDPADGIPVRPAEHFLCGGIAVDDRGRTSLDRLFAVGECARTGVHGANRLASTSLLEGLVWGLRAGEAAAGHDPDPVEAPDLLDSDPALPDRFARDKVRRLERVMAEHVGIERDPEGLRRALGAIRRLKGEVDAYVRTRTSRGLYELRGTVVCALLVTRAAAANPESRGCHRVVGPDGDAGTTDGAVDPKPGEVDAD